MILSFENVSFKYVTKPILNQVDFVVNEKDKWGVVGVNGSGKSTLLKIMAGEETPDSGTVNFLKKYRISYCPQHSEFESGKTVYQTVKDACKDETEVYQIKSILTQLKITEHDQLIDVLSGGQKKRVALAIALIQKADLYLFDEPTNHLDTDMINWLEKFINRINGAVVLVTHDRYFLSRITNHIVDVEDGHLYCYEGNYADYLEQREIRYQQRMASEAKRQNFLRNEIEWIRAGAPARSTKAKDRIARFEKIAAMEAPKEKEKLELKSATSYLGRKTIEWSHISKAYDDKVLFNDFSYMLNRMDRIGVIGSNGCGKSTFLKILLNQIQPDSGTVETGETVRIGYFAQNNVTMDPNQRVIDYLRDFGEIVYTAEKEPITASQMLERFLFHKDMQYTLVGKCSGGERRRLYLCSLLMQAPNILLLDEPTNDLDTETLTILEDYLDHFKGAVITVSHDRYFLDKACDKLFVFEDGKIDIVQMDYSSYLENREKKAQVKQETVKTVENTHTNKLSYKEKRELDQLESELPLLEGKVEQLNQKMNTTSDYVEISNICAELESVKAELEEKTLRWMELEEKRG